MTLRCNFLHFSEQARAGRKPGGRGFVKSWRCWAGASARPPVTFDTCRECDPEVKQARSSFPGHLLGVNASLLDLASLQPSQGDPASHSQTFPLFLRPGLGPPSPSAAGEGPRQGLRRGRLKVEASVVANPSPQSHRRDGKPPRYFLGLSGNRAGPGATARIFKAPASHGEPRRHWTFLPARLHYPSFWYKCLNFPGESLSPHQLPAQDQSPDTQSHMTG